MSSAHLLVRSHSFVCRFLSLSLSVSFFVFFLCFEHKIFQNLLSLSLCFFLCLFFCVLSTKSSNPLAWSTFACLTTMYLPSTSNVQTKWSWQNPTSQRLQNPFSRSTNRRPLSHIGRSGDRRRPESRQGSLVDELDRASACNTESTESALGHSASLARDLTRMDAAFVHRDRLSVRVRNTRTVTGRARVERRTLTLRRLEDLPPLGSATTKMETRAFRLFGSVLERQNDLQPAKT